MSSPKPPTGSKRAFLYERIGLPLVALNRTYLGLTPSSLTDETKASYYNDGIV